MTAIQTYGIPWNSTETRKFRGNGQIPRRAENCGH